MSALPTVLLGLCSLMAPQAETGIFEVLGEGSTRRLTSNVSSVNIESALLAFESTLGWDVHFETSYLRQQLARRVVDLAFTDQDPETVARLIAMSGDADITFNDYAEAGTTHRMMIVVSPPSAETESGRARLRQHSVQWYRTLLQDDLALEPIVSEHGVRARMELANLLMASGEFGQASQAFVRIVEDNVTHDYVPLSLLRIAECEFELAKALQRGVESTDERISKQSLQRQIQHLEEAERRARVLTTRHPEQWETASAVVFLAELMLFQGRNAEAVQFLSAQYLRLAGAPEVVDLYLLAGKAERRLGHFEQVLENMNTLHAALDEFRDLEKAQWLDYLFLRADALQRLGENKEAMVTVETFLGAAAEDSRLGAAFIILGRSYLEQGRLVEAWAAAREAHDLRLMMDREWMREESKFYAKAALAIGDKDRAFEQLEIQVRDNPAAEPELVLYLVDAFLADERFEKARDTADLLVDYDNRWAELARKKAVESLFASAQKTGLWASFPAKAKPYALAIRNEDYQREVADLFGRCYEAMGRIDLAARAFRGMIQ